MSEHRPYIVELWRCVSDEAPQCVRDTYAEYREDTFSFETLDEAQNQQSHTDEQEAMTADCSLSGRGCDCTLDDGGLQAGWLYWNTSAVMLDSETVKEMAIDEYVAAYREANDSSEPDTHSVECHVERCFDRDSEDNPNNRLYDRELQGWLERLLAGIRDWGAEDGESEAPWEYCDSLLPAAQCQLSDIRQECPCTAEIIAADCGIGYEKRSDDPPIWGVFALATGERLGHIAYEDLGFHEGFRFVSYDASRQRVDPRGAVTFSEALRDIGDKYQLRLIEALREAQQQVRQAAE